MSLISRLFHLLLVAAFLLHSSTVSACALSQALQPDIPCCGDGCGDCNAGTTDGDSTDHSDADSEHHDDGGLCLCKAKGNATLAGHAAAAVIALLSVQPPFLISADAAPAFASSVIPVAAAPPDVGRGLPLLF
jgi:hypothetical protein